MNHTQVKNSIFGFFVVCISFLLISCGSGSTKGISDSADSTASIQITSDLVSIPADGARSMAITVTLTNVDGVAVPMGTSLTFKTTLGTFSNSKNTYKISTANDSGTVTVSLIAGTTAGNAVITVESDGVSQSMNVEFTDASIIDPGTGTNEPVSIDSIQANPDTIGVQGTGTSEVSRITATVLDESGQPYKDSDNNIKFEILNGPGGGELLDSGDGAPAVSKTTTTVGGIGSITLRSGTISGTLRIQVTVLNDADGNPLTTLISAVSTSLGIESGEPHNISLYTAPDVQDNGDGSISWTVSALVQDQYGNPVADNTAVYFGIVDNVLRKGFDGKTSGTNQFISESSDFLSNQVINGDTLIILEGQDEGGHIIDEVNNGSVLLANALIGAESNLNFITGNSEYGSICGVALTGAKEPNEACEPSTGTALKGVAHTRLTWAEPAIWKEVYIYAESEGGNTGATLIDDYQAILPVTIDVTFSANKVTGGTPVTVYAHLYDGGNHNIQNWPLTFTTSNTNNSGFFSVGVASVTTISDSDGKAAALLTTKAGSSGNIEVSVSAGDVLGTGSFNIESSD